MKEFWKLVNIWWSYGQEFGVLFFDSWRMLVDVITSLSHWHSCNISDTTTNWQNTKNFPYVMGKGLDDDYPIRIFNVTFLNKKWWMSTTQTILWHIKAFGHNKQMCWTDRRTDITALHIPSLYNDVQQIPQATQYLLFFDLLILRNESELDIILKSPTVLVLKPQQTHSAQQQSETIYRNYIIPFSIQKRTIPTSILVRR